MKTQDEMTQSTTVNNLLMVLIMQMQFLISLIVASITRDALFTFVVTVVIPLSIIIIGNHKK